MLLCSRQNLDSEQQVKNSFLNRCVRFGEMCVDILYAGTKVKTPECLGHKKERMTLKLIVRDSSKYDAELV